MDSFFKVLLTVLQFTRFVSLGFALYGLVWLPRFQNGIANGPHWLLYLYDSGIPILLGIGIVGVILVFAYNLLIALIPGQSASPVAGVFRGLFIWIFIIALIGGLPSFVSGFSHLQELSFDNDNYHLIQRQTNSNTVEYFVYRCADPIGLWCERVTATNDVPAPPPTLAPPPTATPEMVIEGEPDPNRVVDQQPTVAPLPTATPPAELVANDSGELLIKVGVAQAVITSTEVISSSVPAP